MHEYIFQDLFEWAGQPRNISIYKEEDVIGGQSIEYSDPFDIVNDVHHVLSDIAMASGYCSVRLAAYVAFLKRLIIELLPLLKVHHCGGIDKFKNSTNMDMSKDTLVEWEHLYTFLPELYAEYKDQPLDAD